MFLYNLQIRPMSMEIIWNGKQEVCSYNLAPIMKVAPWLNDKKLLDVFQNFEISDITCCSEICLRLKKVRIKVQKIFNVAARGATGMLLCTNDA